MKTLIICLMLMGGCSPAWAEPSNLWQGIMGEAVGEKYQGMYDVACVYRNRLNKGMSLGCIALKRKDLAEFCERQGEKYCEMAKEIIHKVFVENSPDTTFGATHYEAIEIYGVPYWAKDMVITAKRGEHTFYKERSK